MAYGDMSYGVKIYIWDFSVLGMLPFTSSGVGHCSMLITADGTGGTRAGTEYLSWWPKKGQEGLGNVEHQRPRAYGAGGKTATKDSHQPDHRRITDKELEGGSSDHKFQFTAGIMPHLMLDWLDDLIAGQVTTSWLANPGAYNFTNQNCSSTVAHCLRAGGADAYVDWPYHTVWTPTDVLLYCNRLNDVLAGRFAGHARRIR